MRTAFRGSVSQRGLQGGNVTRSLLVKHPRAFSSCSNDAVVTEVQDAPGGAQFVPRSCQSTPIQAADRCIRFWPGQYGLQRSAIAGGMLWRWDWQLQVGPMQTKYSTCLAALHIAFQRREC